MECNTEETKSPGSHQDSRSVTGVEMSLLNSNVGSRSQKHEHTQCTFIHLWFTRTYRCRTLPLTPVVDETQKSVVTEDG